MVSKCSPNGALVGGHERAYCREDSGAIGLAMLLQCSRRLLNGAVGKLELRLTHGGCVHALQSFVADLELS